MFSDSIAVIVLGLLVGIPTVLFLLWGIRQGQFDNLDNSAVAIFDEEELQYIRPWEKASQASERVALHGKPLFDPYEEYRKWL